jgi:hypothetical protein
MFKTCWLHVGILSLFEGSNVFQWEIEGDGRGDHMVCTKFVMWHFMIAFKVDMFKISIYNFCNHFLKMDVSICIPFDINWKHRSSLFESALVIKICICLHVGVQCGGEEHHFDTWRGYFPFGLNYLDVFKEKNQSVIISKTMIFERNQYNFKM